MSVGFAGGVAWWMWRHWRSAAVASWNPGAGLAIRAANLQVRVLGSGTPVVLLLHGMVSAGDSFGAAYDTLAEDATLVVPDLLGFGGSMQTAGPTDATAHIAALDAALSELGLQDRLVLVAGHSMGGVLALRWAAQHPDRALAVVTFGAPLYRDRAEADAHIRRMGRMEALLAGDGLLPRAACGWMCRHRNVASWLAAAYRPDLPVSVARSGVKHTWKTYSGAFDGLIRYSAWEGALDTLQRANIPVTLVAGARDPVPAEGRAERLVHSRPNMKHLTHPHSGHGLPLTDPLWCRLLLASALKETVAGSGFAADLESHRSRSVRAVAGP